MKSQLQALRDNTMLYHPDFQARAIVAFVGLFLAREAMYSPWIIGLLLFAFTYFMLIQLSHIPHQKVSPFRRHLATFIQKQKLGILGGLAVLLTPVILLVWSEPSHAFLLTRLQTFLNAVITDAAVEGSTNNTASDIQRIGNLIVNLMRVGYILFLGVAFFQGFQQVQQSGAPGALAQNAFFSLITILAFDVICYVTLPTTAGVGTGTGAGTGP